MLQSIKGSIDSISRRRLLEELIKVEATLKIWLKKFLDGKYVAMTTDGWTDHACRTYMSTTYCCIDDTWTMRAISPHCSLHSGTATGEDLADFVEKVIVKGGQDVNVVAVVTDCEPSMVKAGRLLEERNITKHVGCAAHRLQSSTGKVFAAPQVEATLGRLRKLVTRYKSSSQATAQLITSCVQATVKPVRVVQDVPTRWSSTYSSIERILHLEKAIKLHETLSDLDPILTSKDWAMLALLKLALAPQHVLQKVFEGDSYVTGSLVIPLIADLRTSMVEAVEECNPTLSPVAEESISVLQLSAREAIYPSLVAILEDINTRWGDGTSVTTFREGPRRQPQGFTRLQVLATAYDPRLHRTLHGIPQDEHAAVWDLVVEEVSNLALAAAAESRASAAAATTVDLTAPVQAAAADATSTAAGVGAGRSASAPKRPRRGLFAASTQEGDAPPPAETDAGTENQALLDQASMEVGC